MCGIAGYIGPGDPAHLAPMNGTLVHRGPDDGHQVSGPGYGLAARRLSIIDVEGGRQPVSDGGDVWACQNGEIYNFQALRDELAGKGHSFRTRNDTEVLAHLFRERGVGMVHRLRGMFAIAVWDAKRRRGLIVRDRAGKKPLYYHEAANGALYFASEIKALLKIPGLDRSIDPAALHHYLSFKHVPAPHTIYSAIRCLPPAHLLELKLDGEGKVVKRAERYWRASFGKEGAAPMGRAEAAEGLLDRLREAVRVRLVSDVPIGYFLSGGLDSTLVCALGAQLNTSPIETFTLVYDEASTTPAKEEDRRCAHLIAKKFGMKHHEEKIGVSELQSQLPAILRHFDEPFAGVISTYFLSRLISRHVKVALSGDGADELFGSYLSHRLAQPIRQFVTTGGKAAPETLRPFEDRVDFLKGLADPETWKWRSRLLVFGDEEKRELYQPEWRDARPSPATADQIREMFDGLGDRDPLNEVLEAEFHTILPDQVLTFVDRLSMAHSLEVRCPYLDQEFVEYVAAIPGSLKIRDGNVKDILKEAARKVLPAEVIDRPKEGFLMPITPWLKGGLEGWVRESLGPERLRAGGIFRPEAVASLLDRFYGGDGSLGQKVFTLVSFQVWWDSVHGEGGA